MYLKKLFHGSLVEFKSVKALTTASMLLALSVILGILGNYTVLLFPSMKISFSMIPIAISGMLYGPLMAGAVGALSDIISFIINPQGGAFFPGWTLNAFLGGVVAGLFLYRNKNHIVRISLGRIVVAILINLMLGTLWLNIQFGFPYWPTFATRSIKQIIFVPVEIALVYLASKFVLKITKRGN